MATNSKEPCVQCIPLVKLEKTVEAVDGRLKSVEDDLHNHVIFRREMCTFRDKMLGAEEERKRDQAAHHRENTEKLDRVSAQIGRKTVLWTMAGVTLAFAGVLVSILAIYVMVKLSHTSEFWYPHQQPHATATAPHY